MEEGVYMVKWKSLPIDPKDCFTIKLDPSWFSPDDIISVNLENFVRSIMKYVRGDSK